MSSPDGAGRPQRGGRSFRFRRKCCALSARGRLFRRKKLTQAELAEQERLKREAQQARYQAELDMAKQRGYIEGYFDRHPPPGGGI